MIQRKLGGKYTVLDGQEDIALELAELELHRFAMRNGALLDPSTLKREVIRPMFADDEPFATATAREVPPTPRKAHTMTPRKTLYVAGPYTRPDPVINTHEAVKVATAIYEHTDWIPMLPHTTLLWHAITPRPIEFWYALDLAHMAKCDAVVRMPGDSSGADAEIQFAIDHDMTIIAWASLPDIVRCEWRGGVS